ncbi:MAG: hypothetical protein H0Z33_15550 [Bacillaceae bacterium]|nr:hypothetical protein [Bacillaceae bacterium]
MARFFMYLLPLLLISAGCSTDEAGSLQLQPPIPMVTAMDQQLKVIQGSYCWQAFGKGECADTAAPPALVKGHMPLEASPGSAVNISFHYEPDTMEVRLWEDDDTIPVTLDQGKTFVLPEQPGYYIYSIHGQWPEGDASYAFAVRVID